MVPYAKLALEFKYFIRIEEVALPKGFKNWYGMIPVLEERNAHNENGEILKRQIGNYEKCNVSQLVKAARNGYYLVSYSKKLLKFGYQIVFIKFLSCCRNQGDARSNPQSPPPADRNNNNQPSTSSPSTTGLFGKNYEKLVLYCEKNKMRLEIDSQENNINVLKLSYPRVKPIFERLFKGNSVENAANNTLQQIQ